MVYTFGLAKHANTRYRDSFIRLCRCELQAMLHALSVDSEIFEEPIGGSVFLTFESRPLSPSEIAYLSDHSGAVFFAEKNGNLLKPLDFSRNRYLDEDLPEILKYKGKTSASFLRLMINIALSLSPFRSSDEPLVLLDPVCGKGTACFCALQSGMNAIGLDLDQKAIRESADFFSRYLKQGFIKHSSRVFSETAGKASLPVREFVFADSREHYLAKDTRFLRLAAGDTSLAPALCRRNPAHLIIADLPYGIQHAPQFGHKPEPFGSMLSRALPHWKRALRPDGVAAISFNTLTFPTRQVIDIVRSSGFVPFEGGLYDHLRHEVEQAVVRDVVFMMNKS